ncbi:hypothetical protein P167DRAFT_540488 [Morchella conica CCBAS932]|uniref:Uncharacterized protein n=1 Tax=Morchella conica CCBAS932 TaxID=1392247 RepID=A0A3N4K8U9_9PEZI|nr:hypothetical protein P167DRAFT_540488 [Morchella conica CCBAS932]
MSCRENLEAWFQINIWGPIFDRCFQYIPKMSISRSESQSPSNCRRKNKNKPNTKDPTSSNLAGPGNPATRGPADSHRRGPASERKVTGSKYDGLITHFSIEYGAVEDSKRFEEETAKKWVSDSLKLAKVLHDQMRCLEEKVKHDRDALGRFQCVGFVTAGKRKSP